MSQRDDEDQPDAPDLGEFVQEDPAETLVGSIGSDPLDAGYIPPDRPFGLDDDQATSRIDGGGIDGGAASAEEAAMHDHIAPGP